MNAHPRPAAQAFLTSAAGVADGDPEGEIWLMGLALGFEKVVHRRLSYSGPILLKKADRGLARVGGQHLLYAGEGHRPTSSHFPFRHPTPPPAKHCHVRPSHTIGPRQYSIHWAKSEGAGGKGRSRGMWTVYCSQLRRGIPCRRAGCTCVSAWHQAIREPSTHQTH